MRTIEIIKGLDKKELLQWEAEVKSVLGELDWKRIRAERTLHLHRTAILECTEKLQAYRQRAEETKMALQFFSETHPLRYKCEEDLLKTEISIFRLENKLKKLSPEKIIPLEIKGIVIKEEINYYQGILQSIRNLLNPPVVLRRVLNIPDGEVKRNPLPDEGMIFPITVNPGLRGILAVVH